MTVDSKGVSKRHPANPQTPFQYPLIPNTKSQLTLPNPNDASEYPYRSPVVEVPKTHGHPNNANKQPSLLAPKTRAACSLMGFGIATQRIVLNLNSPGGLLHLLGTHRYRRWQCYLHPLSNQHHTAQRRSTASRSFSAR